MKKNTTKHESIPVTIRIPSNVLDAISHLIDSSKGAIANRSQAVVSLVEYAFKQKEKLKEEFIEDIESTFSVENKILIPINAYKKLLSKSISAIKKEIKNGVIDEIEINKSKFIVIEAQSNYNDVIVELLVQKKDIEILRKKIESLTENTNT